jgi:hypothetical protein
VTKVEVLVDGVSVKSFPAPIPAELSFALPDPARLHDTDAQVTVRTYDADGNTGERSTRVHVDALAPQFTITPASGATLNGVVTSRPPASPRTWRGSSCATRPGPSSPRPTRRRGP